MQMIILVFCITQIYNELFRKKHLSNRAVLHIEGRNNEKGIYGFFEKMTLEYNLLFFF